MSKLKENEMGDRMMTGLPYSQGGGIGNTGVNTISSPDVSQNPEKFKYPQTAASASDVTTPTPDQYDIDSVESQEDFENDVNAIKKVVTPDEILTGMQYELKKMVFKRKDVAKKILVKNLKRDPKFYSKLHMMQVDENGIRKEAISDIIREMKKRKRYL